MTQTPQPSTVVSNWYPDPSGRHEVRYWDGEAWTGHVADGGVPAEDPLPAGGTPPSVPTLGYGAQSGPAAMRSQAEEYADIVLRVSPVEARDAVAQQLAAKGFRVAFHDDWHATAEKGNVATNVVLGGWAQYFKISIEIFEAAQGQTVVRLLRDRVGYWGGIMGRARVSGTFKSVVNDLVSAFHARGVLVGVDHRG